MLARCPQYRTELDFAFRRNIELKEHLLQEEQNCAQERDRGAQLELQMQGLAEETLIYKRKNAELARDMRLTLDIERRRRMRENQQYIKVRTQLYKTILADTDSPLHPAQLAKVGKHGTNMLRALAAQHQNKKAMLGAEQMQRAQAQQAYYLERRMALAQQQEQLQQQQQQQAQAMQQQQGSEPAITNTTAAEDSAVDNADADVAVAEGEETAGAGFEEVAPTVSDELATASLGTEKRKQLDASDDIDNYTLAASEGEEQEGQEDDGQEQQISARLAEYERQQQQQQQQQQPDGHRDEAKQQQHQQQAQQQQQQQQQLPHHLPPISPAAVARSRSVLSPSSSVPRLGSGGSPRPRTSPTSAGGGSGGGGGGAGGSGHTVSVTGKSYAANTRAQASYKASNEWMRQQALAAKVHRVAQNQANNYNNNNNNAAAAAAAIASAAPSPAVAAASASAGIGASGGGEGGSTFSPGSTGTVTGNAGAGGFSPTRSHAAPRSGAFPSAAGSSGLSFPAAERIFRHRVGVGGSTAAHALVSVPASSSPLRSLASGAAPEWVDNFGSAAAAAAQAWAEHLSQQQNLHSGGGGNGVGQTSPGRNVAAHLLAMHTRGYIPPSNAQQQQQAAAEEARSSKAAPHHSKLKPSISSAQSGASPGAGRGSSGRATSSSTSASAAATDDPSSSAFSSSEDTVVVSTTVTSTSWSRYAAAGAAGSSAAATSTASAAAPAATATAAAPLAAAAAASRATNPSPYVIPRNLSSMSRRANPLMPPTATGAPTPSRKLAALDSGEIPQHMRTISTPRCKEGGLF